MIPMLLVVGSLVPASDSPELATATPTPRSLGASVHIRDQIQLGMTLREVQHLLGEPSRVQWGDGLGGEDTLRFAYDKLGVNVWFHRNENEGWRVKRFQPTK
jgi:hypothetical protein